MTDYDDSDVLHGTDVDNIVLAVGHNGVLQGMAVSEHSPTPDMSVDVASGSCYAGNTYVSKGSSSNVTITTADGSNPRWDLIVCNNAGTLSAVAGTPAATPAVPEVPANSIVLAFVYVGTGVSQITNSNITDRRQLLNSIQTYHLADNAVTDAKLNSAILNAHIADTHDPHGSSMTVSYEITTTRVESSSGNLEIEAQGSGSDLNLMADDNINLMPSGKTYSKDDLRMDLGSVLELADSGGNKKGSLYAYDSQTLLLEAESGVKLSIYGVEDLTVTCGLGDYLLLENGSINQIIIFDDYIELGDDIIPVSCGGENLGDSTYRMGTIYTDVAVNISSCDVAEWYPGEPGEPGDVYVIEPVSGLIYHCIRENDPNVIGAYSERPALEMGNESHKSKKHRPTPRRDIEENGRTKKIRMKRAEREELEKNQLEEWKEFNALIGLIGKVPVKIVGSVLAGDFLITSATRGAARAITKKDAPPLFVLGRALIPSKGRSRIDMFAQLQILYHNPLAVAT